MSDVEITQNFLFPHKKERRALGYDVTIKTSHVSHRHTFLMMKSRNFFNRFFQCERDQFLQ